MTVAIRLGFKRAPPLRVTFILPKGHVIAVDLFFRLDKHAVDIEAVSWARRPPDFE